MNEKEYDLKLVEMICDPEFRLMGYNLNQIRAMITYCRAKNIEFCPHCGKETKV